MTNTFHVSKENKQIIMKKKYHPIIEIVAKQRWKAKFTQFDFNRPIESPIENRTISYIQKKISIIDS